MRAFVAVALVLLLFAASTGTASAHAEPAQVTPGDGAVLTAPPAQVAITMSQEMFSRDGANDIDVIDAAGNEVTSTAAALDRNDRTKLVVALPSALAPGRYSVRWKTLSAEDGDPAEGALSFTYDPNGAPNPGKTDLREDPLTDPEDGETPDESVVPNISVGGSDNGVTWVLVVAVGIGMFVLGAGGTFLLVQRKP